MKTDHYTYSVTWSAEDGEHAGLCVEFPSLSWLAATPEAALAGIRQLVKGVVRDMKAAGEPVPTPLAEKRYSGEFRVRIPPQVHRSLALQAAEQGVSLNRLASAKLSS
ncbi:MAG: toxin-antitoxin system HicB family antitoxin [Terracidiphilus sp.]|jgi:predicted HicB family RNase H-like nuclease